MSTKWIHIKNNDDTTYPDEGEEVLVSDGINCDVAWFLRSGEYKWLKADIQKDTSDDFQGFVPIKWKLICP